MCLELEVLSDIKKIKMDKLMFFLLFCFFTACSIAQEEENESHFGTLNEQLLLLETKTALVAHSQQIDDVPLWSPNSDAVGYFIGDKWYKVSLTHIHLEKAVKSGLVIGAITTDSLAKEMTEKEVLSFKEVSETKPREVITSDGKRIQLKMYDLRVSLIVIDKDGSSEKIFTTGGENCHSLTLSPDEKYVSYLCELTGLFVMKIE